MNILKIKRKKIIIILASLTLVLATLVACGIYLSTSYKADEEAIRAFSPTGEYTESETDFGIVFMPDIADTAVIFYPGGKVDHRAYIPLMRAIASQGIGAVLVEMPFNLAVFDVNAAHGIRADYPDICSWYLAGHSLGGSMAATYLADNASEYEGIILLASYSTADLSDLGVSVLSVYGNLDGVLNLKKYAKYKSNLPLDHTEYIIEGGNHAGFGMYGKQSGDGDAEISSEEQIITTAELIYGFIKK